MVSLALLGWFFTKKRVFHSWKHVHIFYSCAQTLKAGFFHLEGQGFNFQVTWKKCQKTVPPRGVRGAPRSVAGKHPLDHQVLAEDPPPPPTNQGWWLRPGKLGRQNWKFKTNNLRDFVSKQKSKKRLGLYTAKWWSVCLAHAKSWVWSLALYKPTMITRVYNPSRIRKGFKVSLGYIRRWRERGGRGGDR